MGFSGFRFDESISTQRLQLQKLFLSFSSFVATKDASGSVTAAVNVACAYAFVTGENQTLKSICNGRLNLLPESCHGDQGVPKSCRNAYELCTLFVLFKVVHHGREGHH